MSRYLKILNEKYATFKGRARRTEFWMFYLITVLFFIAFVLLDLLIIELTNDAYLAGFLSLIYSVFLFLPFIAVTARRLHDIDKSAWWLLLNFIPVIGGIILLILLIKPGTDAANKYGADPKIENPSND